MGRTLVIGDIHGGLRALKQVFERAEITGADKLIFVGDYVDGWSESAQTVDFLMELQQPCVFIKGNHDLWCEQWLERSELNEIWLRHGGAETLESYRNYSKEQKEKHLSFFKAMCYFYIDDKNRLFVHGGFSSLRGPAGDRETDLTMNRTLLLTAINLHGRREYPEPYHLFHEIFIGHTPVTYLGHTRPLHVLNVWAIDTGAAFKGRLTVLDADTKQFWQSDPLPELYPGERGRN